jgi:hypothetical protein
LEPLEDRQLLSGISLPGQVTQIQFTGIPVGTALTNQFVLQGLMFAGSASSATAPVTSLVPAGQTGAGTEVAGIPTSVPTGKLFGQSLLGLQLNSTPPIPNLIGGFANAEQAVSVQVGEEAVPQGTDTAVLTLYAFDGNGQRVGQSKPLTVTAGAGFTSVLSLQRPQGDIHSFAVVARLQDANKPLEVAGISYQAPNPIVPLALPYFTYTPDNLSLVIHPGQTIKDHITIIYFNNSAGGPIQLSVAGLPPGVTATFVPSTNVTIPFPYSVFGLPKGSKIAAADMVVSAAGNAPYTNEWPVLHTPPGNALSELTLTAKSVDGKAGPGVYGDSGYMEDTGEPYTFPISLEVRPQFFVDVYSPSNTYETELDALPLTGVVAQARITREPNFSGPVNLQFKGLPAGVTPKFFPASLAPGNTQANFELIVAGNASWGPHPITLEATSGYLAPVDVPLTLVVQDPIQAKYEALRQNGHWLGPPIDNAQEFTTADGTGKVENFQQGMASGSWTSQIYWWPETGANEIEGRIFTQWSKMGQETGPLGRITQDTVIHPPDVTQYTLRSVFEHGAIQDDYFDNAIPNLMLVAYKLNDTTMRFSWQQSLQPAQNYDFFQVRYAAGGDPDTQVTVNAGGTAGYWDVGGLKPNTQYHFSVQGATNRGFGQGPSYTPWATPIFVNSGNFTPPAPPPPSTPPQTPDNLPWLGFLPNALGEGITLAPVDLGAIAPKADTPFTVSWQDFNFSNNNAGAYVDRLVVYQEQDNAPSQLVYDSSTAAPDSLKVNQLGAWQVQPQSISFDSGLPAGIYDFTAIINYNGALKEYRYDLDTHTSSAYGIDIEPATRLPAISGQSTGQAPLSQVGAGALLATTTIPGNGSVAIAASLIDVTAQVAISLSSLALDPVTKHYMQTVTLQNTSGRPIVGPLSLVLGNLISKARLVNRTGVIVKQAPVGSPYLDMTPGGNILAPGQSVTLVLEFDSATAAITYQPRVLAGTGQR